MAEAQKNINDKSEGAIVPLVDVYEKVSGGF